MSQKNKIDKIINELDEYKKVQYLKLDSNKVPTEVEFQVYSGSWSIHKHKLNGNETLKTEEINQLIEKLTEKNLDNILDIRLSGDAIDNSTLKVLTKFPKLSVVALNGKNVTDISPLQQIKELGLLELKNSGVTDISPLQHLKNLNYLYLEGSKIKDISPLRNMDEFLEITLPDGKNGEEAKKIIENIPLTELSQKTKPQIDADITKEKE